MKFIRQISIAALLASLGATAVMAQDAPPPPPDGPEGRPMRGPGPDFDFVEIDADKDGSVTLAELVARSTARLTQADTNGDGALDRAEIVAAMPGPRDNIMMVFAPNRAEQNADRMFQRMGVSEAGRIEIAALSERNATDLIAALDKDDDGAISAAEAKDGPKHRHGDGPRPPRG